MSWIKPPAGSGGTTPGFTVRDRPPLPEEGSDGDVWLEVPGVPPLPDVPPGVQWTLGSLNSTTGHETANPTRARTDFLPHPGRPMLVTWDNPEDQHFTVLFYGPDPTPLGDGYISTSGWMGAPTIVTPPEGTAFIRVVTHLIPQDPVTLPDDVDAANLRFEEVA